MDRAWFSAAAVLAAITVLPAAAQAQNPLGRGGPSPSGPIRAGDPAPSPSGALIGSLQAEATLPILEQAGFVRGEIYANPEGRHVMAYVGDTQVFVFHESCERSACYQLRFFTSFGKQADVDLAFVNAYNTVRFAKLAIGSKGDLYLDYSALLSGGVTAANVKAHAELFKNSIRGALEFKPN